MRQTRLIMGMPITVEIVGAATADLIERAFAYFDTVDRRFSPYRGDSELSLINAGTVAADCASPEMREVLALCAETKRETDGFFDASRPDGKLDPSGIVKGWAILNAARLLAAAGAGDFFVDAGGDIQTAGRSATGEPWSVGIRSPFNPEEIVRVVYPRGAGVATSGTYVRGQHIYDPHSPGRVIDEIVSLTVIGPDVLEADRFATAAFAMGKAGIGFIEARPGLEGYMIGADGVATMTGGFRGYAEP
jgi:thiamine biosynthesis lipoprotein